MNFRPKKCSKLSVCLTDNVVPVEFSIGGKLSDNYLKWNFPLVVNCLSDNVFAVEFSIGGEFVLTVFTHLHYIYMY